MGFFSWIIVGAIAIIVIARFASGNRRLGRTR